jgi:DNA (cytosine-5)-methyltransferase 1
VGGVADGLPHWLDGYWIEEPDIPRVARGVKDRVNRLRALGSAVVPNQAYPIFKAIAEAGVSYED